jgi:hypothetical protein
METGEMIYMAARWPVAGRRAIDEFITEKKFGTTLNITALTKAAMCPRSQVTSSIPWPVPGGMAGGRILPTHVFKMPQWAHTGGYLLSYSGHSIMAV